LCYWIFFYLIPLAALLFWD